MSDSIAGEAFNPFPAELLYASIFQQLTVNMVKALKYFHIKQEGYFQIEIVINVLVSSFCYV